MTLRVLDCDLVFDALTRGPFPSGQSDDAFVDAHLQSCHECRQIAEALRPAVNLFHEALQDNDQLPGYQGALLDADKAQVEAIMTLVRNEGPQRAQPMLIRRIDPLSVVAAAIVGLVLGLLIASPGEKFAATNVQHHRAVAHRPGPDGLALLTQLDLITACRDETQVGSPHATGLQPSTLPEHTAIAPAHNFHCCTRCHHYVPGHGEHGSTPEFPHMGKLLRGCQACHKA